MYSEARHGEMMSNPQVQLVARLPFGEGIIGKNHGLESPEAAESFAADLSSCVKPITKPNTADCVDERDTVALGDGTTDPHALEERIVHQLPGGLVLAVTKAAVAADLAILRDTKQFQSAYETMYAILDSLGYEDGGHKDCGASKKVESSVADEIPRDLVLATLPAINPLDEQTSSLLDSNWDTKRRRLEGGFYSAWSNTWHEDFLKSKVPQNFSILAEDPNSPTNGHNGEAILLIKQTGMGFAKKQFISKYGREAFAETVHTPKSIVNNIISKIGGSELERARFQLEFDDDAPQVLNKLVAAGMPVYAQAA